MQTAEVVANRYKISREDQDQYALQSQLRTAKGQKEGKFVDEIISVTTSMAVALTANASASHRTIVHSIHICNISIYYISPSETIVSGLPTGTSTRDFYFKQFNICFK